MYELLIIWFFCIAFSSMTTITLTLSRKPLKQTWNDKCKQQALDAIEWFESLPDPKPTEIESCIDDEEIASVNETPEPVPIPRTGKVTMLAKDLAKCLNIVKDTVGSHTLPILNKVKIDFKDGMATFTTTNLETVTVTRCGCKIESEFTCLLPFKILKDLSELLYDDIVTFEQDTIAGQTYQHRSNMSGIPVILIKQGRQTITLFDDDPKDYPLTPKVEGQSVVISELPDAIKKVKDKMIANDNKHWNCSKFAGLYFDLSKPEIVATDGNRMKIAKLECESKDVQFRIDKDCALLLTKFKDMDCLVTSNDKATRFDFGTNVRGEYPLISHTIITQNLQGKYPDYESLKETEKDKVSVC